MKDRNGHPIKKDDYASVRGRVVDVSRHSVTLRFENGETVKLPAVSVEKVFAKASDELIDAPQD